MVDQVTGPKYKQWSKKIEITADIQVTYGLFVSLRWCSNFYICKRKLSLEYKKK